MAPTRRKPTKRKVTEESIGAAADALSVDELRPEEQVPRGAASGFAPDAFKGVSADEPPYEKGGFSESNVVGAEEDAAMPAEGEQPAGADARVRPAVPGKYRRIAYAVVAVVVALLVIIEGGFCLARWAVDDAADMQGSWYVNGSQSTIAITAESIVLDEEVAYEYAIDEAAKTITYQFGIMEGSGRYRFSLDRTQLAIIDGEFEFMDTLTADISWMFEAVIAQIKGEPLSPGSGDGVMHLTRAANVPAENPPVEGDAPAEGDPQVEGGETGDAVSEEPASSEADPEGEPEGADPGSEEEPGSEEPVDDEAASEPSQPSNPGNAFEVNDRPQGS